MQPGSSMPQTPTPRTKSQVTAIRRKIHESERKRKPDEHLRAAFSRKRPEYNAADFVGNRSIIVARLR